MRQIPRVSLKRSLRALFIELASISFLVLLLRPGLTSSMTGIPSPDVARDGLYRAVTEDGVTLALKRYRPNPESPFRTGAQPVIMMPGMLGNFYEFDMKTPDTQELAVRLPDRLAPWAERDPLIRQDPMLYYSMAYALWAGGLDVWLANYRGQGRPPYESGGRGGYSIDDLAVYDVPAVVSKVYEVSGKHPVWLGHSMGSTMAYMSLEGALFSAETGHIVSSPDLVHERNAGLGPQAIKGLVALDGPVVPSQSSMDTPANWALMAVPFYLDLRGLGSPAGSRRLVYGAERLLWGTYRALGRPNLDSFNGLLAINVFNIDPAVNQFLGRFAMDGVSTHVLSQLADAGAQQRLREHFLNGPENKNPLSPPEPYPGDGYYYYSDHLNLITLPALVIVDNTLDITAPADIDRFYQAKTRHPADGFFRVPNTAHIDLVMGLNAPEITYPMILEWIQGLD
jgi:hypothetical protein